MDLLQVYRPLTQNNLECFFNELTTSLSQARVMCDSFIGMGGFNIDINLSSHEHDKLEEFCNLFDLSNLTKSNTCFTKKHNSKIDLILTNNSNSFQKSGTTETCLSYFHKLAIYRRVAEGGATRANAPALRKSCPLYLCPKK